MKNFAIRIENLGKRYRIGRRRRNESLTDAIQNDLGSALRAVSGRISGAGDGRQPWIWALQDINLEVSPGEAVGVIGSNGSGKTTLLKILSRITVPTRGRARLRGRVSSLLEVGTGFHPELTGRENVYLNGSILGMRRREIQSRFDEIVSFSEIEEFLDTPVKFYSSGMRMRLAFSVAAHLEPEILLVDEVLAVGDIAFQQKSLKKMGSVVQGGRTVLFVSHNMAAVKALCRKGIFLEHGHLKFSGEVGATVDAYLNQGALQQGLQVERPVDPGLKLQIMTLRTLTPQLQVAERFDHDGAPIIELSLDVRELSSRTYLRLYVLDENLDILLATHDIEVDESIFTSRKPGSYTYRIQLPPLLLAPGSYRLSLYVIQRHYRWEKVIDSVEHVCPFEVVDNGSVLARVGINWKGHIATPIKWDVVDLRPVEPVLPAK